MAAIVEIYRGRGRATDSHSEIATDQLTASAACARRLTAVQTSVLPQELLGCVSFRAEACALADKSSCIVRDSGMLETPYTLGRLRMWGSDSG